MDNILISSPACELSSARASPSMSAEPGEAESTKVVHETARYSASASLGNWHCNSCGYQHNWPTRHSCHRCEISRKKSDEIQKATTSRGGTLHSCNGLQVVKGDF